MKLKRLRVRGSISIEEGKFLTDCNSQSVHFESEITLQVCSEGPFQSIGEPSGPFKDTCHSLGSNQKRSGTTRQRHSQIIICGIGISRRAEEQGSLGQPHPDQLGALRGFHLLKEEDGL